MHNIFDNKELKACLETLENAIVPEVEEQLLKDWLDFTFDRFSGELFCPQRSMKAQIQTIPQVYINDSLEDTLEGYTNMALSQFSGCLSQLAQGSGSPLGVRCNYGVGIMPSLFGCEIHYMKRELNTLPSSIHLNGENAIKALLDARLPHSYGGFGGRVFKMAEMFNEIKRLYPKIGKYVFLYHPDMQGPMDIAELLWGSEIFYGLMDEPELCHQLLRLINKTYLKFFREWERFSPSNGEYACHWGLIHRGTIMLRNDSAMNLSPAIFEEFIKPYDQELFKELGGGAMHFCGRGDHYLNSYCDMKGIYAINMTQTNYNNMEAIFCATVDRGIKILQLEAGAAEAAVASGRKLHSCVSKGNAF